MGKMRAVSFDRAGPAAEVLELGDLAKPVPGPGEVLVRLGYSGINPSDVKLRAGQRAGGLPYPRIVPHSDGAGEIEALGEGVEARRLGEAVWVYNGQWQRPFGTAAQWIALPAEQAVRLPAGVTLQAGACLGIPAQTGCHVIVGAGPLDGRWVLIQGAGGAVARYALQFARRAGARIAASVGGPAQAALAKELGAHAVVQRGDPEAEAQLLAATGGHGFDLIVDGELGANIDASARLLADNGEICSYGSALVREPALPFYPLLFKSARLRFPLIYLLSAPERLATLAEMTRALEAGDLDHAIDQVYPLERTAEAHERVESGQRQGAVLVRID